MKEDELKAKILEIATSALIELNDGKLAFDPIYDNEYEAIEESGYREAIWPWRLLAFECLRYLTVTSLSFEFMLRKRIDDIYRGQFALTVRACQDCQAIIALIDRGHTLQAETLLATTLETLEFACAGVIEPSLMAEFVAAQEPEKANAFWHSKIARSKARKKVDKLFDNFLEGTYSAGEYREWRTEALRKIGAVKHPSYAPTVLPAHENFPDDAVFALQLPIRRKQSVNTIQLLADACVEYASTVLLTFAPRPKPGDEKRSPKAKQGFGLFDELWLDSYAARGHKFMQLLWIYFLENQDQPPFVNWRID